MRVLTALVCCLLAGCSAIAQPLPACPLPSQEPFTIVELFFGRDIPGRGQLTDAEWSNFAAKVITDQFPDGFTVLDGEGQWFDQRTGQLVHEPSKILISAADPQSNLATRIGAITAAYRSQFHQQSVGVVTSAGCGAF
jgi:hypothetical protein